MELRLLRYFMAVAQHKNISKAASFLHITQPTLSRQMKDLEQELGVRLFERGKKEITLSEDGVLFLQKASDIVNLTDRTVDEFRSRNRAVKGTVSIAGGELAASHDLAKLISEFYEDYPYIRFELLSRITTEIYERLDSGLTDFGLIIGDYNRELYEGIPVGEPEATGILLSSKNPLSKKESLDIEDIRNEPISISSSTTRAAELMDDGIPIDELNVVATHTILSNSLYLIEEDLFMAITVESCLGIKNNPKVKWIPLNPSVKKQAYIIWPKNRAMPPSVRLFSEFLLDCYEEALAIGKKHVSYA